MQRFFAACSAFLDFVEDEGIRIAVVLIILYFVAVVAIGLVRSLFQ